VIYARNYLVVSRLCQKHFKTFKKDKELDQWGSRLLDESVDVNVASLDFLVSQVSGMKELLHQHYSYLYRHFYAYDMDYPSLDIPAGTVDSMLIVTSEELMHWRELDAVYVTMEFGFVNRATQEALKEHTLLQIEQNVFIPQCIEDIFFILSKVTHRALSTGSESNVMGVGNRILETIRETPPGDYDKHSFLYRLVTNKAFFGRCIERKSVSSKALARILNGPKRNTNTSNNSVYHTGHNSVHHTPHKGENLSGFSTPNKNNSSTNNTTTNNTATTTNATNTSTTTTTAPRTTSSTTSLTHMLFSATEEAFTTPGSPAIGLVNTITDITNVSLTGMNWWLSDQLSPYLGTIEGEAEGSSGIASGIASGIGIGGGGIAMKDSTPLSNSGNNNSNNAATEGTFVPGSPTLPPAGRIPLPPTNPANYNTPNKQSNKQHKSPTNSTNNNNSTNTLNSTYNSVNSMSTVFSAPTSTSSALSLDEMLLNALVGDESTDNDGYNYYTEPLTLSDFDTSYNTAFGAYTTSGSTSGTGSTTNNTTLCTDEFEHSMRVDELRARLTLSEDDWVVQLNTLCTIASCTGTLRCICSSGVGIADIYKTNSTNGNSGKSSSSPIEIILQVRMHMRSVF